jgi:AAA15 family ATPase/GTPase
MITGIKLANFKSFGPEEQNVSLGRITVLIGENATGKSSLIQSLALLHQSVGNNQLQQGQFKFSSYGALVHDGHSKKI